METDELAVLVQAVAAGSLSGAARRLGVTPTIASRRLAALEDHLGVRLMHRTTRSVSLTPEGEALLPHAQAMLEIEQMVRCRLAPADLGVSGVLRVTAPASFGRKIVAPLVPAMLDANPELRVDLELTDSVVDIVAAGIDVAVRIGRLRESTLIARRLAPNPRVLCASPIYLERRGTPRTVEALADHECLVLSGTGSWPFDAGGKARDIRVSGRFASNSVEAIREACIGGLGIALLSRWDVVTELNTGALVRICLETLNPQEISVWAVYPSPRLVAPKVRTFITSLERALGRLDGT
ncbi:LysR family transcriptional regulator [Skermanella stibiiresistens SB22]|uniref:LysR family transcriptional regulator n=1 Tax=Skermanella stibiiresistens SB22 TaxID=1385369 RepID=W9H2Q5_9PROT|nr:LysR family transcriptional regulator [Skermanella stibiiresistens]EWY40334.1 LysR family transcriptional regulator [Skermanella stibiiresistens SB22]